MAVEKINLRKDSDAFGTFWSYEYAGRTWHASTREAARKQLAMLKGSRTLARRMTDAMFGWVLPTWNLRASLYGMIGSLSNAA